MFNFVPVSGKPSNIYFCPCQAWVAPIVWSLLWRICSRLCGWRACANQRMFIAQGRIPGVEFTPGPIFSHGPLLGHTWDRSCSSPGTPGHMVDWTKNGRFVLFRKTTVFSPVFFVRVREEKRGGYCWSITRRQIPLLSFLPTKSVQEKMTPNSFGNLFPPVAQRPGESLYIASITCIFFSLQGTPPAHQFRGCGH